jgi:hypothetical protein
MKATKSFKQSAPIGVAGGFINQLMANNDTLPEVGLGATILHYTDRSVCDVVAVSDDKTKCTIQELRAVADKSKPCDFGHQNWLFEKTDNVYELQWRNGAWRRKYESIEFTADYLNELDSMSAEQRVDAINSVYQKDEDVMRSLKLIPGKTKKVTQYPKVKILFGQKDYYYDWSF